MNITEAAIEAASLALHCDACTDDEHDACDCSDWAREAKVALEAALPYLQPDRAEHASVADITRTTNDHPRKPRDQRIEVAYTRGRP